MTREQAQLQAPAVLHLPNDGADYRCDECQQLFPHNRVMIPITPDGKIHQCVCDGCIDQRWLSYATDCGVIEPPTQPLH